MAAKEVYSETTVPNPKTSCFMVPSGHLEKSRFMIKVGQVLLSFVAFVLEEVVNSCSSCGPLYFFEFGSCTAFLFTLLLLILLATVLHTKVGITCWSRLDFFYTVGIFLLFLISSIVFASDNGGTTVERAAVVFGFLATATFFLDTIFFIRTYGFPLKNDRRKEASNGNAAPLPEAQQLTAQ